MNKFTAFMVSACLLTGITGCSIEEDIEEIINSVESAVEADTDTAEDVDEGTTESLTCSSSLPLTIESATDEGNYQDSYKPELTIDDDFSNDSRWSSEGTYNWIQFDLGAAATVTDIAIAFLKADERSSYFSVQTSEDGETWAYASSTLTSDGESGGLEAFELTNTYARYVRVYGEGNSEEDNDWNSYIEVQIFGCSDSDSTDDSEDNSEDGSVDENTDDEETVEEDSSSGVDYGLDASLAPAQNFDLWDWYLSVPTDTNDDGKADSIKEDQLNEQWHEDNSELTFDGETGLEYYESEYFYTDDDTGAMVFVCTVGGYKTSSGTTYTRTELREMLRRGDTSIGTSDGGNNWAFSTIDNDAYDDFGGIDGTMTATLAVNRVTTTSTNEEQVGRIIVGQIHAEDNEPVRLYYHKQPNSTNGALYFAHEPSVAGKADGEVEMWYNLLGEFIDEEDDQGGTGYSDDLSEMDPSDGIPLDEIFSYKIDVDGDLLSVFIYDEAGSELAYRQVNMASSLYDDEENYMYFKAGIYLNDKTSDEDDTAMVSFYALSNAHDGYSY
ncbi:polysaccharide lyase family 7 protein [Reinekea marinisedimentorum]|uniref:Poly(Beta-D-mannuronate) lyase n=1 Tax=Reinekea marinisedimentorum TaxID=230495 RepID=A0A4R3I4X0_9GAMM|nr:polysaccharide lyase family 7 protein [Reinekea marinisedimentorum]TCS39961.1 poly(beta-D-mannuronate) lyase [Reinekea marinisedimentorum]